MKFEDLVCSRKLAKRLKELGVKQTSLYYWIYDKRYKATFLEKQMPVFIWERNDKSQTHLDMLAVPDFEIHSAFTLIELGNMLPPGTESYRKESNGWGYMFSRENNHWHTVSPKEADARALMLIRLIKDKMINVGN